MTSSRFTGRVVVVAGDDDRLPAIATGLVASGAFVAFVSIERKVPDAHAAFRADPTARDVWERVAPHVEQRLGPVDAVVCDAAASEALGPVLGPDLSRRGHGGIIVLTEQSDPANVLSAVADML